MGLGDNRIPEDKLPSCWSDDVRMNALFAPFRLKSANPESWEMKMKFWSDMLRQWCRHKSDPIVSAADARVAFHRKGRTPACLEIVIDECFQNGEVSPISKYQQILHNGPEGWVRWGARIAFKPAALAFTAVSFLMPGKATVDSDGLPKASIDSTQRFVLESAVQEQATDLLHNFPPDAERIGSIEELMRGAGWPPARRETFELLLGYLVSQGLAVKKDDVVKLADSPSSKPAPVSESELALCRLGASERRLAEELARLAREAERAGQDAKALATTGNRLAAKTVLRRKHTLLARAEKCAAALDNVQQLAMTMRQAGTDATVVNTYKMSADALKRNMKEGGLDEDAVHDTMDDLKDVLDSYAEVEKALSTTVDDVDAAELEEELMQILNSTNQPSGGSAEKDGALGAAAAPARKVSERDFIFDGEERVLAELNELGLDDSPRVKESIPPRSQPKSQPKAKPVAVAEGWTPPKTQEPAQKPTKSWYPREVDFALDSSLDKLSQSFSELRTDDRLHPGQKLDVQFPAPSNIYSSEFTVRDHTLRDGVWLFNCKDTDTNTGGVENDTVDYFSASSPGKAPSSFQMAPGGERKPSLASWTPEEQADTTPDDLQRRLDHLRGFL
ncbi:charged multivesicular body protein 7 [Plutella xylostella]|uniref:charged multivesicular body protein 7 n=1 Tax=Plutella xylostella TaxID=51655 RepID=UPI002032BF32|nr:charged multivesicular body protein 7 [Plutella xylostella]